MNAKTIIGFMFFLVDVLVLITGAAALYAGIHSLGTESGEGGIKVVVTKLGQLTGINGSLLVILIGAAMVVAALGYALKAYQEAVREEGGLKDTIRHFAHAARRPKRVPG
jgi:hypothetical protein